MKALMLGVHSLCLTLILFVPRIAAAKDACTLLSPAQASTALGVAVGPPHAEGEAMAAGKSSACRYRSTLGRALAARSVSLNVQQSETDLTGSSTSIAENLKAAGFKNVHQVAGIGSAAVWASNSIFGRLQGELTVIEGKSLMLIVIIQGVPDEADSLSRAKAIAAAALQAL